MWRFVLLGLVVIVIVLFGFSLVDMGEGDVSATALISSPEMDTSGYAQAVDPWGWQFPRDHGPHPEFQTEWWYYTGNVVNDTGRRFGFQFTIFRRAITPTTVNTGSEWRTGQVYMAHFTISDIADEAFYHGERYSRGSADLAGATVDPVYRVWLEDWQVQALNTDVTLKQITAMGDGFGIDVTLEQVKPIAFQGDNGLSPKSKEPGNASYYYSLSRLVTSGTVTIGTESFAVSGNTWMDHEFSTSALSQNAVGWDWFGLIFDEGYELMVGKIRRTDIGREPGFGGLLIFPDGSTRYLEASDFEIEASGTWESPHTGAVYPAGWTITIQTDDLDKRLRVTPLMSDQELHNGDIAYWEGAVRVEGDFNGYGYAELTGYADVMTGRI